MAKGHILVVDDEQSVLHLLEQHLKKQDYEVTSVLSGAEALEVMKNRPADVVLLDYLMPEMNGLQALVELKKLSDKVVIVMMTGHNEDWVWKRAKDLEVYDYLVKPIDLEYLSTLISTKLFLDGK